MTEAEKASYLARREKILQILTWLIGQWDLAEWLTALVGSNFVTMDLIDNIESILVEAIKNVQDEEVKAKLLSWVDKIRQMKAEEMQERSQETKEVENALLTHLQF